MERLLPHAALRVDESLVSTDGRYLLLYQRDGNLVLYDQGRGGPLWAIDTAGTDPGHALMQDGNHSMTLRQQGTWEKVGSVVYAEPSQRWSHFPAQGERDECQIDKSGRWLLMSPANGASGRPTTGVLGSTRSSFGWHEANSNARLPGDGGD